jgi:pimeloyl-ACP methyl ester carboxylesterase
MSATRLLLLVVAAAGIGCRGPRAERATESSCTHVQAARQVRGVELCEDVWTCARPPGARFDRIGLHRLAACQGAAGPVFLYLPGMHMNGELPILDPRYDLRLYLAQAGVRTWGLDYRTHAVPPDAKPQDLELLDRWTADTFAGDAAWAAGFVRGADPAPLFLGGFSYGAGLAYRVAARPGEHFAGLVILDGAAGSGRAPEGDGPAIDVGGHRLPFDARRQLLASVVAEPRGPSPVPGFPSAGDALAEILYTAPAFGGSGGLADTKKGISDVQVLARLLASYDRWWPRGAFEAPAPKPPVSPLPVLAFTSTNMGPPWVARVRDSAQAFGGPQATLRELPGHGHLDVLVGRSAARQIFEPVRVWLVERSGG